MIEEEEVGANCTPSRWMQLKAKLQNVSPDAFKALLEKVEEVVLIDTRTATEYQQVHLQNAININYLQADMWEKVEELDKGKTYLLYCRSGRRSIRLGTLMRNGGFDAADIYNLEGGLIAWQAAFGEVGLQMSSEE